MRPINKIRQKSEQLLGQWPQSSSSSDNPFSTGRHANPLLVPVSVNLTNRRRLHQGFRKSPVPANKKDRQAECGFINLRDVMSKGCPVDWSGHSSWQPHTQKTMRISTISTLSRQRVSQHYRTEQPQLCVQNRTQGDQLHQRHNNLQVMEQWRKVLQQRRREHPSTRRPLRLTTVNQIEDSARPVHFSNIYLIEKLNRTIRASHRHVSPQRKSSNRHCQQRFAATQECTRGSPELLAQSSTFQLK